MRIVHITPAGGYGRVQMGGAERAVIEMVEASAERGHDIALVAPAEYIAQVKPSPRISVVPDVVTPDAPVTPAAVARLSRVLQGFDPDIIVCHLLRGTLAGGMARLIGTPSAGMVTVLHSSLQQAFVAGNTHVSKRIAYRAALRLLHSRRRSSTIAISPSNYDDLVEHDKMPGDKIRLIPDWVAPAFRPRSDDFRAQIRRSLDMDSPDTKMILFAGRLEDEKNPLLAVKAVSALDAGYRLVIAGDGNLATDIEALADRLHVPVTMLGQKSNIEDYMATADVLVMTSRYEGFGRVAVEALATGTPVVSTPVAGLLDTLSPFTAPDVQFVDSEAPEAWRDAIMTALAHGEHRDRSVLYDAVMREYGLEKALDAYFALYEELRR